MTKDMGTWHELSAASEETEQQDRHREAIREAMSPDWREKDAGMDLQGADADGNPVHQRGHFVVESHLAPLEGGRLTRRLPQEGDKAFRRRRMAGNGQLDGDF